MNYPIKTYSLDLNILAPSVVSQIFNHLWTKSTKKMPTLCITLCVCMHTYLSTSGLVKLGGKIIYLLPNAVATPCSLYYQSSNKRKLYSSMDPLLVHLGSLVFHSNEVSDPRSGGEWAQPQPQLTVISACKLNNIKRHNKLQSNKQIGHFLSGLFTKVVENL